MSRAATGAVTTRFAGLLMLFAGAVVAIESQLVGGEPWGLAFSLGLYGVIATLALWEFRRSYPHERIGVCNIITVVRATLISSLAAVLADADRLAADPVFAWVVLAIALVSLALDGFDGYFARRAGLISRFGARFDMEVDAVFAMLLAVLALASGKAGAWVLLLGGMRYLFVAAGLVLPWLTADTPQRFAGKVVCVIQIGVLIALLAPIISGWVSIALAGVALVLLIWSFGVDIVWLARRRP